MDKVDEAYFRETIMPLLDGPDVEFVGEINERAKTDFLGDALALLFPIDWPEPFGLALIEVHGLWNTSARISARLGARNRR